MMRQPYHLDFSLSSKKPVVILPFYGEYGWFILSYIRLVHHFNAPEKIVCCLPGHEAYFPSATKFFYDWDDFFPYQERQGFRNEWPIRKPRAALFPEQDLAKKLARAYPSHELIRFDEPIPLHLLKYFPVQGLHPQESMDTAVDIVICARHRLTPVRPDAEKRNWQHWAETLKSLSDQGFSLGIIGTKETSFHFKDYAIASWDFSRPTDAMISMLQTCQLYLGTDTGPTHLAALLHCPQVVFRYHGDPESPDLLRGAVKPIARHQGFFLNILENGWNHPERVVDASVRYLESVG